MNICTGLWAIVSGRPLLCIDGLGDAEVKRELGNDLPSEAQVSATAQTVGRRDRKGVQHIVLVDIDAVRPFAGIEALEAEAKAERCMVYGVGCQIKGYILRQADAIKNGGMSRFAE